MVRRTFLPTILLILTIFWSCRKNSDLGSKQQYKPRLSFQRKADGQWQVGYSSDTTLNPANFLLSTKSDTNRSIPLWHASDAADGYYPYVGQNIDTASLLDVSNRWAARAGQVVMEGSNNGQFAIIRFIVPYSGSYKIHVTFEGIHFGLSSTDVYVLKNETIIFGDEIEGYGGDSSFHVITGIKPSANFENETYLNQYDIISFAVGYGNNKNHYNDTTGLTIEFDSL